VNLRYVTRVCTFTRALFGCWEFFHFFFAAFNNNILRPSADVP